MFEYVEDSDKIHMVAHDTKQIIGFQTSFEYF